MRQNDPAAASEPFPGHLWRGSKGGELKTTSSGLQTLARVQLVNLKGKSEKLKSPSREKHVADKVLEPKITRLK